MKSLIKTLTVFRTLRIEVEYLKAQGDRDAETSKSFCDRSALLTQGEASQFMEQSFSGTSELEPTPAR